METIKQANRLIHECESHIRQLMVSAVNEGKYKELSQLASLASALSALTKNLPIETDTDTDKGAATELVRIVVSETSAAKIRQKSDASRRKQLSGEFPQFERQVGRLIKLGWSKKEKSVYEHRTPFDVVKAVAEKLASSLKDRGYFRMEEVLPVNLEDGTEAPSYQAYIVLAWLKYMGSIERHGNDGYKLSQGRHLDEDAILELWQKTPERV